MYRINCRKLRTLFFFCTIIQLVNISCTPTPPPTRYRDSLRDTWIVTTFAGSVQPGALDGVGTGARFREPRGIVRDPAGNLYVADALNHLIRKITPAGVVITLAGSGKPEWKDSTGTNASFNLPVALAIDAANNLYVADEGNNRIRKVTPAGVVTTIAGGFGNQSRDGSCALAEMWSPEGIAIDKSNNTIYFSERDYHKIRKIVLTPACTVTTFAGTIRGYVNSPNVPGIAPQFDAPAGLALDPEGKNLYVADDRNNKIRKISLSDSFVTSPLGSGYASWINGRDSLAAFNRPYSLIFDASGTTMYVADWENRCIRKVLMPQLEVQTFAGSPLRPDYADGDAAAVVSFKNPAGIVMDAEGNFYVTDAGNNCIRKITRLKR